MRKSLLAATVFFIFGSGNVLAKEITVCPVQEEGCDYTTIQEAVDNAANGDTIIVKSGLYNEHNVNVSKCINIKGESASTTIINAEGLGNGINVVDKGDDLNCEMEISNLQIRSGSAASGGGIYIYHSDYGNELNLTLKDLIIVGNTATNAGGGVYIQNYNGDLIVNVENSDISKNTASAGGGGIYQTGGLLVIENSKIEGNSAVDAGGIYNYSGSLRIVSSVIDKNIASGSAGGILVGGEGTIIKSWIIGNIASNEGGGIDTHDSKDAVLNVSSSIIAFNKSGTKGGGLSVGSVSHNYGYEHTVVVKSSTIAYNEADSGDGIFVASGYSPSPVNLQIHDTVFYHDGEDLVFEKDSNSNSYGFFILKYNAFSKPFDPPGTDSFVEEENVVIDNPGFKDAESYDFSLVDTSPLIDKADSASVYLEDIAGSLRLEAPDIGACEYPSVCKMDELQPAVPSIGQPVSSNFTEITTKINLVAGWNLVGIPSFEEESITSIFGDDLSSVFTLWKWDRDNGRWELYTSDEWIRNYVESFPASIELLNENSTIRPGEGFWVKATSPFTLEFKGYEKVER